MRTMVWGGVIALGVAVCSAIALRAAPGAPAGSASALQAAARQTTTNDGIYSTAQAEAAKPTFEKTCGGCHHFTVAARKHEKDLPLGDEPFLKKWEGRALDELLTIIVTTMPNDGSAVVSDEEALNLLAFVLQQNGFAAGKAPLDKAGAASVIARPVKK